VLFGDSDSVLNAMVDIAAALLPEFPPAHVPLWAVMLSVEWTFPRPARDHGH